jgi:hypothetical protein
VDGSNPAAHGTARVKQRRGLPRPTSGRADEFGSFDGAQEVTADVVQSSQEKIMAAPERPKFTGPGLRCAGIVLLVALVVCGILYARLSYLMGQMRKAWTQLHLRSLATKVEAYVMCEANKKHEFPSRPNDLVKPPFSGTSFLHDGERELIDLWGKPFQFERRRSADGTEYILIWTTAPDGTPISQFGIGEREAFPEK